MGAGARSANVKAKNQAMAAAMKDTASRKGVERTLARCPICYGLIAREIVGCKSAQRGRMLDHILSCKGPQRKIVR